MFVLKMASRNYAIELILALFSVGPLWGNFAILSGHDKIEELNALTLFLYIACIVVSLIAILWSLKKNAVALVSSKASVHTGDGLPNKIKEAMLYLHPLGLLSSLLACTMVATCYIVYILLYSISEPGVYGIWIALLVISPFFIFGQELMPMVIVLTIVTALSVVVASFVDNDLLFLWILLIVMILYLTYAVYVSCTTDIWTKDTAFRDKDEEVSWYRLWMFHLWNAWWISLLALFVQSDVTYGNGSITTTLGVVLVFSTLGSLWFIEFWTDAANAGEGNEELRQRLEDEKQKLNLQDQPDVQFHL